LNQVREARETIIQNFANQEPPHAYAGEDPAGAARSQDKQSKYTQYVQMSTQLMSEFQNTERELVDLLTEGRRNIDTFWESYSGMKESEVRTTRTVIDSFRG
jgi:hypothetical protein